MRTYSVSKFKAHALAIISGIAETGQRVVVTKRGKPLVVVEPYGAPEEPPNPGKLVGTITFEEDIVSPLGAGMWEATGEGGEG